ncbi:hypothetical protein T06_4577 [Trichinella sp. T6]|nr:hypothetical protein T06_4577 [Trichinella sp. T6]
MREKWDRVVPNPERRAADNRNVDNNIFCPCKNRMRVLYACDAQIHLGQPNAGQSRRRTQERTPSTAANGESIQKTGPNNSTRNRWLLKRQARAANKRLAQSSCYAFGAFDLVMVVWPARPSGGFFKYFIDSKLAQWPQGSLGPQLGVARRRNNDLASGERVLFFLRPRPLGTYGTGGVTPTGSLTFRTEQSLLGTNQAGVRYVYVHQHLTIQKGGCAFVFIASLNKADFHCLVLFVTRSRTNVGHIAATRFCRQHSGPPSRSRTSDLWIALHGRSRVESEIAFSSEEERAALREIEEQIRISDEHYRQVEESQEEFQTTLNDDEANTAMDE